ncbi:O-antigen ligase [uncultured Slackia sp.]|uniref:O-antigen ligase family protein n=1 Tax=uncultured Slackia sp. TaxID=665903 RepID=UPI0026040464|nr:O-antigen ligase family protein [uncultured Slackia sp.]
MNQQKAYSNGDGKTSGLALILSAGCFITIMSQIESRLSIVFTLIWISSCLFLCVKYRHSITFSNCSFVMIYTGIVLGAYCSACYLLKGEIGYLTGFYILYLKCLLMYLIGLASGFSKRLSQSSLKKVAAAYVLAAFLYLIWVMLNYFPGFSVWSSSHEYLYESKNSMGQICGVAAIILFVGIFYKQRTRAKVFLALGFVAFAGGILIFQCRTAFIGILLSCVMLLIAFRKKRALVFIAVALLILVLTYPPAQGFIQHAFFVDKYSSGSADAISSGRLTLWSVALECVGGNELFGLGDYYVDNLYINLFVNLGAVGTLIFLPVWLQRIVTNFRYRKIDRAQFGYKAWLGLFVSAVTVFYIFESLLEGQPPFGPGACSFLFWMSCGFLDSSFDRFGKSEKQ